MKIDVTFEDWIKTAVSHGNNWDYMIEGLCKAGLPPEVSTYFVFMVKRNGLGKQEAQDALDLIALFESADYCHKRNDDLALIATSYHWINRF